MSVIATIITSHFTAHSTDSFITVAEPDGTFTPIESFETKIVRVHQWRGAMAYYGLARHGADWSTLDWLQGEASRAGSYDSAEDFAFDLSRRLTQALSGRTFQKPLDKVIGIHFTAYERIGDYWIPELFHIRNWEDPLYSSLRPDGAVVTRETYGTLMRREDRDQGDRDEACRLAVHSALHNNRVIFRFNNGDPLLFNPVADALLRGFQELLRRGKLRNPSDVQTHLSLVRRPVEVVLDLQTDLMDPRYRRAGGRPHDLAIAPDGTYKSSTGD